MKQKQKPPLYRLTVTHDAFSALLSMAKPVGAMRRADGKFDVGISFSLLDQLKTAALPQENLSNTVLRIWLARNLTKGKPQ